MLPISILVTSVYRANDFSAHDMEPISVFAHITCCFVIVNLTVFVTRPLTATALKDVNYVRRKSNDAFNFVKLETVCAIKKRTLRGTTMLGSSVRLKELINEDIY